LRDDFAVRLAVRNCIAPIDFALGPGEETESYGHLAVRSQRSDPEANRCPGTHEHGAVGKAEGTRKMSNVQNNTTSATTTSLAAPQALPQNAKSLMAKVKATIKAMNVAEARSRKALAEMVASFVEMGEAYIEDQDVTSEIDADCKAHGIDPVNLNDPKWQDKIPNILLPMISIIDGKWEPVFDPKTGKPVKDKGNKQKEKWVRNRSFEKYASVVRFFIHNGISHLEVVDILMGDDPIPTVDDIEGFDDGVRPRISDIVRADTAQQNGKKRTRTVWSDKAKGAANAVLKPVGFLPFSEDLKKSFTLSEDGYAAVIVRIKGDDVEILGDTGLHGDALFRVINKRVSNVAEFLKKEIKDTKDGRK
jgi:hypothetical protein